MSRKIDFSIGEYYHLYARGVDKRIIFVDDHDRDRFVRLLYISNGTKSFVYREIQDKPLAEIDIGTKLVSIGAYCLMPNHFHILVRETSDGGISKFMSKLLTGYSSYFNKRHGRTGRLFEGTFRAEHAKTDNHLKYLFSYLHLNPIKLIQSDWKEKGIEDYGQAVEHLSSYKYSSYGDYVGEDRDEGIVLSQDDFPAYFESVEAMGAEVREWLTFSSNT